MGVWGWWRTLKAGHRSWPVCMWLQSKANNLNKCIPAAHFWVVLSQTSTDQKAWRRTNSCPFKWPGQIHDWFAHHHHEHLHLLSAPRSPIRAFTIFFLTTSDLCCFWAAVCCFCAVSELHLRSLLKETRSISSALWKKIHVVINDT